MSRLTAAKSAQILKDNIREKNIPLILGSAILGFAILINLHVVTNGISKSDFNSLIRGCGQILFLHKIDLSFLVIAMILGTFTLIGFSRSKKLVSNGTAINIFLWLTLGSLLFWCRLGYFQDVIREFVPVLSLIILAGAVINFALQIKFKPQRRSKVRRTPPPDPMQQQQQADSQQLHVSADGQAPGSPHSPLSDHSSLKESTLTQDLLSDNSNSNSSSQATNTAPFPPKQSLVDSACHSEVGYPPNPEVLQVPVNPDNEIRRRRRNCDLSSLSISDDEGNEELNFDCSRSVFWKKRYNGFNKSGINFGPPVSRSSSLRGNQSLLRPATFSPTPGSSPKINSFSSRSTSSGRVAKASWVAGGYWQRKPNYFRNSNNNSHIMDDEDSRPSSKSSGFISTSGKNLTNGFLPAGSGSRACSLFGDQGGIERAPSVVGLESVINKSAYQPQGLLQQSLFSQHAMIRTSSQKGSSDCSDDLISQISALGGDMTPRASSSPIAATAKNVKKPPGHPTPTNWMEKQISCTVFNLLLGISVALNVLVLPIVAYKLLE